MNNNTEIDILEAARRLFLKKGFKETTVREIVKEANTSKAMLNYYYRSKEKLFFIVFDEAFHKVYSRIRTSFLRDDIDFAKKLELAVSDCTCFFNETPQLPIFIAGEVARNPNKIGKRISELIENDFIDIFNKQFEGNFGNNANSETYSSFLIIAILSLCVFPIIAKPVLKFSIGFEENKFEEIFNAHQSLISPFVLAAIHSKI